MKWVVEISVNDPDFLIDNIYIQEWPIKDGTFLVCDDINAAHRFTTKKAALEACKSARCKPVKVAK